MSEYTSVVLVGIGGYGGLYINALLDFKNEYKIKIAGFVDPYPEACVRFDQIKELKIPIYGDLEAFYKTHSADLAVISSPIQYHMVQTCIALKNNSNVLCEKPIAASLEEVRKMIETRNERGKFVAIGYQWSFSKAIIELKKDILIGKYGQPIKLKTIVLWPRDHEYYRRGTGWAGKIKDAVGNLVLDSVVSNATAHFLHNMFFILGESLDNSIMPINMIAETYRANNIENFDTAAIKLETQKGACIYYYASHAVDENFGPVFEYVFEKGVIYYGGKNGTNITSVLCDGSTCDYGDPYSDVLNKLWLCVEATKHNILIPCPIEAAIPHVACIEALFNNCTIRSFNSEMIVTDKNLEFTYVSNLAKELKNCFVNELMPNEAGLIWAVDNKNVKTNEKIKIHV